MSVSVVPKQERRRRRLHDEGEDATSENPTVVARTSECESEDESPNIELSEYESAVDDSADQEDETEEGSETEEESGSETEGYTDEEGLGEERQSGDGEEQPENDKPDDDEDKKNPAYVPRKGAFYEHDFRHGGEGLEEVEIAEEAKPKKKLWQDEGKWSHDRYIEEMQAPKSRQELIEAYGYDIRSADRPPEAPPKQSRSAKGPRKQHFKDFMPRMAVIDTTDGGLDSVPNLDDEEFIQFNKFTNRNPRRGNVQNSDLRRDRRVGRGNYNGNDVETKNDRNRAGSNRANLDSHGSGNMSAEDIRSANDFPSLSESSRQGIPKDVQGWKRGDNSDIMWNDTKPSNNRTQKSYPAENHNSNHRNDFRNDNRDRFQQTQDIRRQDETKEKNRTQQGFKEDRKDNFNHSRSRGGNLINQAPVENWRSAPKEFRDGYNKGDDYRGNGHGSHHDYGYSRRNQHQQLPAGGNRGPKTGNSGDAGDYYGGNKRGNRGFEQPTHKQQQPEMTAATSKEAREYTNSSYKYSEAKYKQKNVNLPSGPTAGINAIDDSITSNIKSIDISNKENVQTINVTITSTTTEKKSYAKERRAKGVSRPMEGTVMVGSVDSATAPVAPMSGSLYQSMPPAGIHIDLTSPPLAAGANHYPSNRQGMFTESPLVGGGGTKLYDPSLPPPSFYQREHGGLPPNQHPGSVQDPAHFSPTLLPPTSALPFGLPVSNTGLALPPNAAGIPTNPALFQPPPSNSIAAPATAIIAAPFLPAGMIYGGGPRVPPPGTPTAFPLNLAYTSPPPQAAVAAAVVGSRPPPQGTASAQGLQAATQHKKVYRGDITYYAPELQQPSRTPQKRPKAAIPIIDPQEVPGQKMKEKSEKIGTSEKFSMSTSKNVQNSVTGDIVTSHVDTTINSAPARVTKAIAVDGHDQKTLSDAEQTSKAQSSLSGTTVASSAPLQTAQVSSSSGDAQSVTTQANCTPVVSNITSVKSTPSLEGSEYKRMAFKTELSPGGPPVNKSMSNMTLLSKDTEQSLCTAMQNFQMENSASKIEVGATSAGNLDLKEEVCEKPLASSKGSSVA